MVMAISIKSKNIRKFLSLIKLYPTNTTKAVATVCLVPVIEKRIKQTGIDQKTYKGIPGVFIDPYSRDRVNITAISIK